MAHEQRLVICHGPGDPHAFDGVPLQPRRGQLDRPCRHCHGHGQWNGQIDLASQRSIRVICDRCEGRGWIETGSDPVMEDDIELSPEGYPQWFERRDEPGED